MLIKTINVAAYARCSTLLNQDPANQLEPIRAMAEARGFNIVAEYVDLGISGGKERRPELDRMLKDAMAGKFQILIVAALDRLARSTKHSLTLIENFHSWNLTLISLRENLDFSTPTGMLVLTMITSVAQLEKTLISERIRIALATKKMMAQKTGSNWRCGRPNVITKELEVKILELRKLGLSIRKIQKELGNVVGHSTVHQIIKNSLSEKGN